MLFHCGLGNAPSLTLPPASLAFPPHTFGTLPPSRALLPQLALNVPFRVCTRRAPIRERYGTGALQLFCLQLGQHIFEGGMNFLGIDLDKLAWVL